MSISNEVAREDSSASPSIDSPSPFCVTIPRLQKAWDNSSLQLLKDCPRKYQYAILEGWRPKHTAAPLIFGSMYHNGLEEYDTLRGRGADHATALRAAIRKVMIETTWEEDGKLIFWDAGDNNRSRESLVRSIVWYCEHFKEDALQTYILPDGTPAIELSFRYELPLSSPDLDPYFYCGHLDKLAKMGDMLYVVERKTSTSTLSSSYFARYNPNGQITGYAFSAKVVLNEPVQGVIVDATQTAVNFARFGRSYQHRNEEQLEEWLSNTLVWIKVAEDYAKANYWPMNEEACHKYSGCQYREVCSKSALTRDKWLESDFLRNPWNPLVVRGGSKDGVAEEIKS